MKQTSIVLGVPVTVQLALGKPKGVANDGDNSRVFLSGNAV